MFFPHLTYRKKVLNPLKNVTEVGSAIDDRRGKHTPANKTNENILQVVFNFITNLPAVPSHYCRASTSRRYLPADIRQPFETLHNSC